ASATGGCDSTRKHGWSASGKRRVSGKALWLRLRRRSLVWETMHPGLHGIIEIWRPCRRGRKEIRRARLLSVIKLHCNWSSPDFSLRRGDVDMQALAQKLKNAGPIGFSLFAGLAGFCAYFSM